MPIFAKALDLDEEFDDSDMLEGDFPERSC